MRFPLLSGSRVLAAAVWALASATAAPAQTPDSAGRPIDIRGLDQSALPGAEDRYPLQVTGFGVASYHLDGRTRDNSFAAGKLAVALFREINDYAYLFGQLTTALERDESTGAPATNTEIDNLLLSVTVPGATGVAVAMGKLDLPIGFERDDEPLNFLASPSFNADLARPLKMTGLMGSWAIGPRADLSGFVFNGWEGDLDPNHGKSVGARLGAMPADRLSLGLSGLYGPEGNQGSTADRYLLTFDYAVQPSWDWIVAGEANLGGDRHVLPAGGDATWGGGMMTVFHQLSRHLGVAARAELFRDGDGARTGLAQTLTSYTLAPIYSLGVGREGIFANVQHTTFRIPRLQLRVELRLNHSTAPFFETRNGPGTWGIEYRLQAVTTF
jgi:hypothetical protein